MTYKIWKLAQDPTEPSEEPTDIEVQEAPVPGILPEDYYSRGVEEFIRYWGCRNFILRLKYIDRNAKRTERRVESYKFDGPYYWAYGLEPGTTGTRGIRMFRFDRIEEIDRAKGRYWPRWPVELDCETLPEFVKKRKRK